METPNPTPDPAPAEPTPDDRTWGMFSHLLPAIFSVLSMGMVAFLSALVIWLVKKDEGTFVAEHAKESLNFQISFTIVAIAYWAISFPLVFACAIGVAMWYVYPLLVIAAAVLGGFASAAANRGEMYRYPYTLRLIP